MASIVLGTIISIYNGPLTQHAEPAITATDLIVVLVFGVLGLQFIFGIQALNKFSGKKWNVPSWSSNPFDLKQPAYFFHFGGWFMLISTTPIVVLTYLNDGQYILDALILPLFGIGILGGVYTSTILFKNRYKNV